MSVRYVSILSGAVFLAGIAQASLAHQCQLQGNDASSISQYNQCKADLNIKNMHPPAETSQDAAELEALRAENKQLRLQLELVKTRLFDLLKGL
ncbi:MAG: hypothetical protein ACPG70_08185 [Candidatus Puniceispirillaceae bacterium]